MKTTSKKATKSQGTPEAKPKNADQNLKAAVLERIAPKEAETKASGAIPQSTALAVAKPQTEARRVNHFAVPVNLLAAALVSAAKSDPRSYMNGVHIELSDGVVKLVSTDGSRMFIASLNANPVPAIPVKGATMSGHELGNALAYFRKARQDAVKIEFNDQCATLAALDDSAAIRVPLYGAAFPNWKNVAEHQTAALNGQETVPLQTSALKPEFLRDAAKVAAELGCKAVFPFVDRESKSCTLVSFAGFENALLYIMPMRLEQDCIADGAARIIGKGLTASIGALKAHVSRQRKLSAATKNDKEKKECQERMKHLEERIAALAYCAKGNAKQLPKAA